MGGPPASAATRGGRPRSLSRRILTLVAVGILLLVATLGTASWIAVRASIDRLLHERLVLAQATADHLERALHLGLRQLGEEVGGSFDPADGLEAERQALSRAAVESIFGDGVFLLDAAGAPLLHLPPGTRALDPQALGPALREALDGRPAVSNVVPLGASGRKLVAGLMPLRGSDGAVIGVVGGGIDLTGNGLTQLIETRVLAAEPASRSGPAGAPVPATATHQSIDLLDGSGTVLASTRADQLFRRTDHRHFVADQIRARRSAVVECHGCHRRPPRAVERAPERQIMALAPLASIPWAVAIRQDRQAVLSPAAALRDWLIAIGVVFLLGAALVALLTVRSVVHPIFVLSHSVRAIARGELDRPVPELGDDEIGELGRHVETMRQRLRESIGESRRWNRELEVEVSRRTAELRATASQNEALYRAVQKEQEARRLLLHKVIGAQEEERRRVARELHDSTSQELAALSLALATLGAGSPELSARLTPVQALAAGALEGIHRLIFDLRPAMLDDLGLASALRWQLSRQFEGGAVQARLEVSGDEKALAPGLLTTLFRLAQEAIANVARHAHASQVLVSLSYQEDGVVLEVQDDGVGFDPASLPGVDAAAPTGGGAAGGAPPMRGLGLLGMRERVLLWDGRIDLDTGPDAGTRVRFFVPYPQRVAAR